MLQNYRTSRIYKGRNLHECAVLSRTGAGSENGGSLRGHFLRRQRFFLDYFFSLETNRF